MKKSLSLAVLILVFFFVSTKDSNAQFRLKLGPLIGMNFNIGTGSDLPETATGFGMVIGSQVDMRFSPVIGLITQIQFYDNMSGGTSQDGTTQGQDQQGRVVNLDYTIHDDKSIAYFMIEPMLKLNVPASGFYFLVGPTVGFNIESSREVSISSANNNVTFNDGTTKNKSTLKNMLVRFALTAGAGYDIPAGGLITITPQFTFAFGITNVQSDFSSRILNFQLATIVKFNLI